MDRDGEVREGCRETGGDDIGDVRNNALIYGELEICEFVSRLLRKLKELDGEAHGLLSGLEVGSLGESGILLLLVRLKGVMGVLDFFSNGWFLVFPS